MSTRASEQRDAGTRRTCSPHPAKRLCMAKEAARSADCTTAVDELPAPLTTAHHGGDPVVEWLTERVDERRPAVLRDLLGRSDDLRGLRGWLSSSKTSDVASALATVAPSTPVTSFVSQKENFYLDGTSHPRAILTTSMSTETTMSEHVRPSAATAAKWPNRYVVEEIDTRLAIAMQLPSHAPCHTALGGDECGTSSHSASRRNCCSCDGDRTEVHSGGGSSGGTGNGSSITPTNGNGNGADCCCVAKRQIFLTVGRSKTQLHRDTFANLYLCLSGSRSWELAHPSASPQLQRSPGSVPTPCS